MEEIIKKIEEDKKRTIEELNRRFLEERKKLEEAMDKRLKEFKKSRENFYRSSGEKRKKAIISSARIEAKRNILKTKREVLNTVFKDFFDRFLKLKDEEYYRFVDRIIKAIPEKGQLYIGRKEREATKNHFLKMNKELKFKGRTDEFDYGIKIVSEDINYIFDFSQILKEYFREKEKDIFEKLCK